MTDDERIALAVTLNLAGKAWINHSNDELIKKVKKMNLQELFAIVMEYPEYLTDGYYYHLGSAIQDRYTKLTKE